jgi:hypothetical protein
MTTRTTLAQRVAFTTSLKREVRQWLSDNNLRQKDLALKLGITQAGVSANLHPDLPMSESFIRMLSAAVPDFADSIHRYNEVTTGPPLSPERRTAAEARKARAEKIKLIRQTEKEVQAAVHGLFEELLKIVDSD